MDGDEELARALHESLNSGDDTTNDALLAAMLQHEVDSVFSGFMSVTSAISPSLYC